MTETPENQPNKFDGLYGLMIIFRNRWFVIAFTVIATAASVFYSLNVDLWYAATTNAVPPSREDASLSGAMSGISSALKDFGLTKLSGGGGESYTYLVMLESRNVIDSIIHKYNLPERYELSDTMMSKVRKAFSANYDINYTREGNFLITVWDTNPDTAAMMANDFIHYSNQLAVKIYRQETINNRKHLENRIRQTDSNIVALAEQLASYSKKYQIFAPEDQAKAISLSLSELQALQMQNEIKYKTYKKIYGENDPLTKTFKGVLEETNQRIIEAKQDKGFAGNFALEDITSVAVDYMRIYTELETFSKVKAILLPMLEEVRLDENKNINNLYVVDEAIAPDKKDRPKRSVIVAGTFLGSFVFSIVLIFLVHGYKRFNVKYRETMKKLNERAKQ